MKLPYLGKTDFYWCMNCNLPLLGKRCGKCGEKAKKVKITPPGDIRPAFPFDVELINKVVKEQYGCEILPENKIAVLNPAPGFDRFDEVIIDGEVLGTLKYDVDKRKFVFIPRLEGARRIWEKSKAKYVEVSEEASKFVIQGKSVLMPGVVSWDESIEKGEEIIVVSQNRVIAVGRAKFSGREAKKREKGMFVRVRKREEPIKPRILKGGQTWEDVLQANKSIIENYEREAIRFIERVIAKNEDKSIAVAFSGGKDSLATLLLVRKVFSSIDVIFTDTGIEFPETIEYVKKIAKEYKLRLFVAKSNNFWKGVGYFGMPARDYRWCCKVVKLGPTAKLIKKRYGNNLLSFIGQRRYESQIRASSKRIWINPWLPSQTAASPIQNWRALHVWLFLFKEKAEVNPLYYKGLERIGCWLCPASDMAEFEILRSQHPELFNKLKEVIDSFEDGKWRWLKLRKKDERIFEFEYDQKNKKVYGMLDNFEFDSVAELSKIFNAEVNADANLINFEGITINKAGEYNFSFSDEKEIKRKLWLLLSLVERAMNCFSCGICEAKCKYDAIVVDVEAKPKIKDNCKHCLACHYSCPIVRYHVNRIKFIPKKH